MNDRSLYLLSEKVAARDPTWGEYLHLWGPALDYVLAHAFIVRTRAAASFFSARCT